MDTPPTDDQLQRVAAALESLPPRCAKAFMLLKYEHMTLVKAAEVMQLPVEEALRYAARALAHVHEVLQADSLRK